MPHPVIIADQFGNEFTVITIPSHARPEIDGCLAVAAYEFQRASVRLYGKASRDTLEGIERKVGETISTTRKALDQDFRR